MRATRRVLVMSAMAALLAPAAACASHTSHFDVLEPTVAGCEARNAWGMPAPGGSLAQGTYSYVVTAITAVGEVPTQCGPVSVTVGPGQASVVAGWNATAAATGYRVYRSGQAILVAPMNTVLPAANVCTQAGGRRCAFLDAGTLATDPTVTPPGEPSQAGDAGGHPDLQVLRRVDYGGADPNSNADDPAPDPGATSAALRTEALSLPPGLAVEGGGTRCALTAAGPSLLGSLTSFGSDDGNEDTCPLASQVGTIQAIVRTGGGIEVLAGDVYAAEPAAGETLRLFWVLRPRCSAGHPVAPGSAFCTTYTGAADREMEKLFLVQQGTTSDGALTLSLVRAEDGASVPSVLTVLVPAAGPLVRTGGAPFQAQRLDQRIDAARVTLPLYCGQTAASVTVTTYADTSPASATATLPLTGCTTPPADLPGPTVPPPAGGGDPEPSPAGTAAPVPPRTAPPVLAAGTLKGVRAGRPVLNVTISRAGALSAERLTRATLSFPKGLTVRPVPARTLLRVNASVLLRRDAYKVTARAISVRKLGAGAVKVTFALKRGALAASRALRRRGTAQRLAFRIAATDASGRVHTLQLKLKPRS